MCHTHVTDSLTLLRFILGLCDLLQPMELQIRRQVVRIVKSGKVGWALGFHPDARWLNTDQMSNQFACLGTAISLGSSTGQVLNT